MPILVSPVVFFNNADANDKEARICEGLWRDNPSVKHFADVTIFIFTLLHEKDTTEKRLILLIWG